MVNIEEVIKGIYCIENKIDGKMYIGQSFNIQRRWQEHIKMLNKGKHHNRFLQRAWDKYGEDNFDFYIVEQLYTSPRVVYDVLEIYYISEYCTNNNQYGYNLTMGGEGVVGYKFTKEQREKISKVQLGKSLSEECKKRLSLAHKEKIKNGYKPKTDHLKKFVEEQKIPIDCYDRDGNYLKTYESIQEAGRVLNLEATNICKVLKRKHSNIKGYVFYYCNDPKPDKMEIFLRCSRCPMILYDENYNEIKIFHDCGECGQYIGISNNTVSHDCKDNSKMVNKYYGKYYYDVYPENKPKYNR